MCKAGRADPRGWLTRPCRPYKCEPVIEYFKVVFPTQQCPVSQVDEHGDAGIVAIQRMPGKRNESPLLHRCRRPRTSATCTNTARFSYTPWTPLNSSLFALLGEEIELNIRSLRVALGKAEYS